MFCFFSDTAHHRGVTKLLEPSQSPRLKPKLRTGASFRFLKKAKKASKRQDRPIIEHYDSNGRERLQSTLENNEKELYQMQRANSGSMFPTSFYFGKRRSSGSSIPKTKAEEIEGVEVAQSPENEGEILKSRSYPEFQDINGTSADNTEIVERPGHRPFSVSSSPAFSRVESNQLNSFEQDDEIEKKNRRRSHSEENLSNVSSSLCNEFTARLTAERKTLPLQSRGRPVNMPNPIDKNLPQEPQQRPYSMPSTKDENRPQRPSSMTNLRDKTRLQESLQKPYSISDTKDENEPQRPYRRPSSMTNLRDKTRLQESLQKPYSISDTKDENEPQRPYRRPSSMTNLRDTYQPQEPQQTLYNMQKTIEEPQQAKERRYSMPNNLDKGETRPPRLKQSSMINLIGKPPTEIPICRANEVSKSEDKNRKLDDPFFGEELATFMTIPTKQVKQIHSNLREIESDYGQNTTDETDTKLSGGTHSFKPLYGDEYLTTLSLPKQQQRRQQILDESNETPFPRKHVLSKMNNNYNEVSNIFVSEVPNVSNTKYAENRFDLATPSEPSTSNVMPVRPPRKKDKYKQSSPDNNASRDEGHRRASLPTFLQKDNDRNLNYSDGCLRQKEFSLDHLKRTSGDVFPVKSQIPLGRMSQQDVKNEPRVPPPYRPPPDNPSRKVKPNYIPANIPPHPPSPGGQFRKPIDGSSPPFRSSYYPPPNLPLNNSPSAGRRPQEPTDRRTPPEYPYNYPPPNIPSYLSPSDSRSYQAADRRTPQQPCNYQPSNLAGTSAGIVELAQTDRPRSIPVNSLPKLPVQQSQDLGHDFHHQRGRPTSSATIEAKPSFTNYEYTDQRSIPEIERSVHNQTSFTYGTKENYPYSVDKTLNHNQDRSDERRLRRDEITVQESLEKDKYGMDSWGQSRDKKYDREIATMMVPRWGDQTESCLIRSELELNEPGAGYVVASPKYEQEMATVMVPRWDRQSESSLVRSEEHNEPETGYVVASPKYEQEMATVMVPRWDRQSESSFVMSDEYNEPGAGYVVASPKYEQEMATVMVPRWDRQSESSLVRSEEHNEPETGYVVASPNYKQEMATVMVPRWDRQSESSLVRSEEHNEPETGYVVASPNYEQEMATVMVPRWDRQSESSLVRSEEHNEPETGYVVASPNYEQEMATVMVPRWDRQSESSLVRSEEHNKPETGYVVASPNYEQEMATVMVPRWDRQSESSLVESESVKDNELGAGYVARPKYDQEMATVMVPRWGSGPSVGETQSAGIENEQLGVGYVIASPKYEQEMPTVIVPRWDKQPESSLVRSEEYNEIGAGNNVASPIYQVATEHNNDPSSYIVAKQVSGGLNIDHDEQRNKDFLDNFTGEDVTNKWFLDNSVDKPSTQTDNKQMYRVTSMI